MIRSCKLSADPPVPCNSMIQGSFAVGGTFAGFPIKNGMTPTSLGSVRTRHRSHSTLFALSISSHIRYALYLCLVLVVARGSVVASCMLLRISWISSNITCPHCLVDDAIIVPSQHTRERERKKSTATRRIMNVQTKPRFFFAVKKYHGPFLRISHHEPIRGKRKPSRRKICATSDLRKFTAKGASVVRMYD